MKSREELFAAARAEFEDRDGGMEVSIREFLDYMVAQGLLTAEGE